MFIVVILLALALGADMALGQDTCEHTGMWGQFTLLFASVSTMCRAMAEILTNAARTAERFERRGAKITGFVLRVLSYPFVKLGWGHPADAARPTWPAKVPEKSADTKPTSAA